MANLVLKPGQKVVIGPAELQQLIEILQSKGYTTIGPTLQNGAITYGQVNTLSDFPAGWTDIQEAGFYELKSSKRDALFDHACGPLSLKNFLHPPEVRLWRARSYNNGFTLIKDKESIPQYAFIGVRPCELQALAIQDKVFNNGNYSDPIYNSRRQQAFIIAINCTKPGGTCFCVSMNTGPKAKSGFDLALTEVVHYNSHFFLTEIGSTPGADLIEKVTPSQAGNIEIDQAEKLLEESVQNMGRVLDPSDATSLKSIFFEKFEDEFWDSVAERCLACGNCTMVCPTCFCTTVEDTNSLDGQSAERVRIWDSCFSKDFSYMHGGSIRFSIKSRYRQWLTHKLSTWFNQFGTCGCVGCGRCITWCPVGIDITESAKILLKDNKL